MQQEELTLWKKKVAYTLDKIGYYIAYDLKDEGDDIVIVPKKNLIHLFLNNDGIYHRRLNIPKIYDKVIKSIDEPIIPDTTIGGLFEREVENILINDKYLSLGYNYAQRINFSFIDAIEINNFFAIKKIKLNDIKNVKEIYFLGENGDGKSLILMGTYLAFNRKYIESKTEKKYTGEVIDMIYHSKIGLKLKGRNVNNMAYQIMKSGLKLKGRDANKLEYGEGKGGYLNNFFAYGVHRGRYDTDNAEQYGFMSLFDNNLELNNPISWLTRQYAKELQEDYDRKNGKKKSLLDEEEDIQIPLKTLIELFQELLEKNVEIEVDVEQVKFKEKGFDLTFDRLSEGYKNLIIWVSDLIFRLHKNQPNADKLNELTGVVMVDEIELHLHPKWQRTLVSKLRKFFPNLQFIFTTHSPTIIQGASDEAIIYKVYRDNETGHTHVSEPYYKKDLDDLMLNSLITSPLFGLDDARMTSKPVSPDTSDSYALSRINKRVEAQLAAQKKNGKVFITDNEIDSLIDRILNEEVSSNEKNK